MEKKIIIPPGFERDSYELSRLYVERILQYNIVTLNLLPGQLVSEYELAQQFGLSRTPIHEALRELSKKSLTTIIPQVGTKISFIDTKRVEAVSFLRHAAEMHMLESVFDAITPQGLRSLDYLIQDQIASIELGDFYRFLENDNAFHDTLFKEAGMQELHDVIKPSMPIFDRVRVLIYTYLDPPRIIREHSTLLAAIKNKDRKAGREILDTHLSYDVFRDLQVLREKFPHYFLPIEDKI